MKLTDKQREVLASYDAHGGPTTSHYGTMNTWKSLIRRGLLTRSSGLGFTEIQITPAGRQALKEQQP